MKKILIIEDRFETRELLQITFEDHYQLLFAENGARGLEIARADHPDLVLLDIMMPGSEMDGLEVCRRLKADPTTAGIVVVFLSAKGQSNDVAAGLDCGAEDYIIKPFSPLALMQKVASRLNREQIGGFGPVGTGGWLNFGLEGR